MPLDIVILGLSITSSWGNGHATTYRGLVRALASRGHRVLFLERDVEWYASNRDLPDPPYCRTRLYANLDELRSVHAAAVREADLVVVGSYVPEGVAVGRWVTETADNITAFYDIDTPVTLARLERRDCDYLSTDLIAEYDLYLSFTGGPTLRRLEREFAAPLARPLYCSVDPQAYDHEDAPVECDLGYLGTYSDDRQPTLERLLIDPARRWGGGRFIVAGPQYPATIRWPDNVRRIDHLPPDRHRAFYNRQRFALNVTRADMVRAGYSPSVRLFEAAACATPIISDAWPGLDELFVPDNEILIARSGDHVLDWLREMGDDRRRALGERARRRVLAEHTSGRRAEQLEEFFEEAAARHRLAATRCRLVASSGRPC